MYALVNLCANLSWNVSTHAYMGRLVWRAKSFSSRCFFFRVKGSGTGSKNVNHHRFMVIVHQIIPLFPFEVRRASDAFPMPHKSLSSALAVPQVENIEVFHDKHIWVFQEISSVNLAEGIGQFLWIPDNILEYCGSFLNKNRY